jgi:hypothetical protein
MTFCRFIHGISQMANLNDNNVGIDGLESPAAAEGAQSTDRGEPIERIIFVHGTGAGRSSWRDSKIGNPSILQRKWWQPKSKFAQELSASLKSSRHRIILPFRWDVSNGGANSERARRVAGRRLLERLRRLDARALTYHLVGHSHGGSVIWHALVGSFLDSQGPLKGLKTWITVGTPFFSWRPDPLRWWWTFAAGLFIATLTIEAPALRDLWLERASVAPSVEQKDILLGFTAALVMVTILMLTFGRLARDVRISMEGRSNRRAAAKARQQYGSKWLGLWHAEDEPIALLSATMMRAPELVARGKTSISMTNPVSAFLSICRLVYSRTLAPAVDEFTWSVLMSRAQGADVSGLRAISCGTAPEELSAWSPLPNSVAQSMSDSADQGISSSAAQIRRAATALNHAQDARQALAGLGALIDWSLLLHTSYFNQSYILTMIGDWIRVKSPPARASTTFPAVFTALPLQLTAVKGLVASIIALALALGANALLEGGVARHLSSRQMSLTVQRIHENIDRSDMLLTEGDNSPIADVLSRLATIEPLSLSRLVQAINYIPSEYSRNNARQRLAYFLARRQQTADALKLADDSTLQSNSTRATEGALIRMQAIIGAHNSGLEIGTLADFKDVVRRTGLNSFTLLSFLPQVLKVAVDRGFFDEVLASINWDSFREVESEDAPLHVASACAVTLLQNRYITQAIKLADSVRDEATKRKIYLALGEAAFKETFIDREVMRLIWSNVGSEANSEVASRASLLRAIALSNDPLNALPAELDKYDAKYDDDIKNGRYLAEWFAITFDDVFLFEMIRKYQRNTLFERIGAEFLKSIIRFGRMDEYFIWSYATYLQLYQGQESARAWCQKLSTGEKQGDALLLLEHSILSASCFKAIGDSKELEELSEAAPALLLKIDDVDQRLSLSQRILRAIGYPSPRSYPILTQLISDMYKTQNMILQSQAEELAIVALCLNGRFLDAWSFASRANRPDMILYRYSMILDTIIVRTFSDGLTKWGFDPRQPPPSTVGIRPGRAT